MHTLGFYSPSGAPEACGVPSRRPSRHANTARFRTTDQSKRCGKHATRQMRQPQAARRRIPRLQTALTRGEPRRAASRRDESICKLRRLLPTPSDDEVIRAALKGLPVRDRPSWLVEYLVDVNHLPNDPTPQLRRRSTTRAQLASPRPSPFPAILGEPLVSTTLQSDSSEGGEAIATSASPRALLMRTPERRVQSISLDACAVPTPCPIACAVPALCGLDLNEDSEIQMAGGVVSAGGGNVSPRAQQYRQEAFDLLAQMGLGQPSREKELPPPEPPNLHVLPAGFRVVECSWDDWRLRELNRQFNKEDAPHSVAKVSTAAHAGSLGLGVATASEVHAYADATPRLRRSESGSSTVRRLAVSSPSCLSSRRQQETRPLATSCGAADSPVPPTRFSCNSRARRSSCTFSSRRPIAGTAAGASGSGCSRGGARHTHSTHSSSSNQTLACTERCGTTAACLRACGRASRHPSCSRTSHLGDPAAPGLLGFEYSIAAAAAAGAAGVAGAAV